MRAFWEKGSVTAVTASPHGGRNRAAERPSVEVKVIDRPMSDRDRELEWKVATATMTQAELREHFWTLPPEIRLLLRYARALPKAEREQLMTEGWAKGGRWAVLAAHLAGAEISGSLPVDA